MELQLLNIFRAGYEYFVLASEIGESSFWNTQNSSELRWKSLFYESFKSYDILSFIRFSIFEF